MIFHTTYSVWANDFILTNYDSRDYWIDFNFDSSPFGGGDIYVGF